MYKFYNSILDKTKIEIQFMSFLSAEIGGVKVINYNRN